MVNDNYRSLEKPRPRPWIPFTFLVLALAGVGYYLYTSTRPQPAAVERRDIVGYIAMSGAIVTPPSAYAEVHAAYSAPVDKIFTTLGAKVRRGDILVQLANPSATETYEQARQNVRAAETAYTNAKRQYDDAVTAARKQLSAASPPNSSSQATSVSGDGVTETTTVTTTTATPSPGVSVLAAALQQAKEDRTAGLAALQQQLDSARAEYRDARAGKRQAQLHAPISGTVIALNAQPGETVGTNNRPVAVIVDLPALQVKAGVTPEQAPYVKPDQAVTLRFDTVPDRPFDGVIRRITTMADPTSAAGVIKGAKYVALVSFNNADGAVKPASTVEVSVKMGEAKNALAVPVRAISKDNTGKPTVLVLEDGKWRAVAVETGLSDGRYIQVKSGLKEGETIQVTQTLVQASEKFTH